MAKLTKTTINNLKELYNSVKLNLQDVSKELTETFDIIKSREGDLIIVNSKIADKLVELRSLESKEKRIL